jgi:YidC/Oxa1 family membrane protein insertase
MGGFFSLVGQLFGYVLWFFFDLFDNYPLAVVCFTLLVRLVFIPFELKSRRASLQMARLSRKQAELQKKYKNNKEKLNEELERLYAQENMNPLGGCLPILLQIPVFFALYATLDGAFALRQVSFGWVANLAAPDTVLSFPLGFTIFGISNFDLNPLVIMMTILMVLQQKLTPTAMDPMQQKMMALMPVFMLIFLYELPSGLTLYWTVSQLFSILQLFLQRRKQKAAKA